jgi:hypothetical protein
MLEWRRRADGPQQLPDRLSRSVSARQTPVVRPVDERTLREYTGVYQWGSLDNTFVADRNKPAWEEALKAAGNRDYTPVVLPQADHAMLEARVGSNAETKSLQRFVPAYFTTVS